ncbi:MAG: hypothetical protein PVI23_03025 [Maricaulaceae bacterium]|jgi:hypothetical protein
MRSALLRSCAGAAALALAGATAVLAQSYEPPRTPDGHPDFQGYWTNISITDLERPAGLDKLVLTEEEAYAFEQAEYYVNRIRDDAQPASADDLELLDGSDLLSGGGYNAFWVDPGLHLARVNGEVRSSWITYPEDGRIPYNDAARARLAEVREIRQDFANPESRPLAERCIIVGGRAGPPMVNGLYNNNYQFVQTPDHLMIHVEMISHARVIPIDGEHGPTEVAPLFGDSVAWWDGDTLVVETTNFHRFHGENALPALLSETGKTTERFTLVSDDEILYAFEVEDPTFYTENWRGEISMRRNPTPVYEYACHEGNYALSGILRGGLRAEGLLEAP